VRTFFLLALLLLSGCAHTLRIGGKDVPVHFVYSHSYLRDRHEAKVLQREVDRAEALDGSDYQFPPTQVIHWGNRKKLPISFGMWLVGYWWAENGESIIHVNNYRVLRHELHHARVGPGHDGAKWDEIEAERFPGKD